MKDGKKIKFVAQIISFSASIVIFCEIPIIFAIIIIMVAYEVEFVCFIPVFIFSLMFLAVLFGITYGAGAYLIIRDEEIKLKGFYGVMRRFSLTDIEKIVYCEYKLPKSGTIRAQLVIVDKHSTDRRMNIRSNGKRKFIKLDFTKRVLKHIRTFWQGEIENLPEKYESHANE